MGPQPSVAPILRTDKFCWVFFCSLFNQGIAPAVEFFLDSVLCVLMGGGNLSHVRSMQIHFVFSSDVYLVNGLQLGRTFQSFFRKDL